MRVIGYHLIYSVIILTWLYIYTTNIKFMNIRNSMYTDYKCGVDFKSYSQNLPVFAEKCFSSFT